MSGSCRHGQHEHFCSDEEDLSTVYSLYNKIDKDKLQCLNEAVDGSGKTVFKSWTERLDTTKFVESDCDEELLFNIPFTGSIKLKSLLVIGGEDNFHPSQMKLFKNRPYMTFDDTLCEPDQIFNIVPDHEGNIEYHTKVARFSNVEHLSIYFSSNFGENTTKIYYIGLKGDYMESHKHGVTICNYEAKANPSDHLKNEYVAAEYSVK
ncbi:PITH domain-containing protein 1 isoform X1 [Hydra vulgaris]|nr:PITH domain-containing protein 1 [Hydra vulgaris]